MRKKPIALEAYEALAEAYATLVDTKPHNAYYERPATLSLLPDVRGKQVLDAGCGPGVYAERLIQNGAEVVAFDVSPTMVRLAQERLGTGSHVLEWDLEEPLRFAEDELFDVVLCALALNYIEHWAPVFREFYRVLRRPGCLVFSVEHPFSEFLLRTSEDYFQIERVECTWKGFGKEVSMPSYRRPLQAMLNPLFEAGFVLEKILEPTPTEEFKRHEPEEYEELMTRPGFLCVRAGKV
jgi:SAM-dependent methyltransferase